MSARAGERVAYLCFHVAGRDVELPVFRKLGFEVYTIKKYGAAHRSAMHDFADDESLTIPRDVIDYLNTVNLVDSADWPDKAVHYLNKYFRYIFIIQNAHVVYNALRFFRGHIMIRLAGLDLPKTYSNYWNLHQPDIVPAIYRNRQRVWMSVQYPNLAQVEDPIFADRAVYMPLGIPSFFKSYADTWTGAGSAIISVLPSLETPYYAAKLERAKTILEQRPFRVLGSQKKKFDDPRIVGFLSNDDYVTEFQRARALFYDSHEPRHVHYPPIEAACLGLPVVFFRNSLLGALGREPLAGACDSMSEVRRKLDRILNNDSAFIESVRTSQKSILDEFLDPFVEATWKAAFERIRGEDTAFAESAQATYSAKPITVGGRHLAVGALDLEKTVIDGGLTFATQQFHLPPATGGGGSYLVRIRSVSAKPLERLDLKLRSGAKTSIELAHTVRQADGAMHIAEWHFFAKLLSGSPPDMGLEFTIPLDDTADASDLSLSALRIIQGAVERNRPVLLSANSRFAQPVGFDGFSNSNPYGLDVQGMSGRIEFACTEDALMANELEITHDRHASDDAYDIVTRLNGVVIDRIAHTRFSGRRALPVAGMLRLLNELRFDIEWAKPISDPEARTTAHITSIMLR